jgi:hypothetical protein
MHESMVFLRSMELEAGRPQSLKAQNSLVMALDMRLENAVFLKPSGCHARKHGVFEAQGA